MMPIGREIPETPLLSVIIPARNAQTTLRQTLDSVVETRLFPLEIIVINDGSHDQTAEIIADYQRIFPDIVSVTLAGKGLSAGRNVGLGIARGRYGLFLDSDDYVDMFALERVVREADARNLDLAMFNTHPFSDVFGRDELLTAQKQKLYDRARLQTTAVLSGTDVAETLIDSGGYLVSACLYVWRRDFILSSRVRFDEGFLMEDNAFLFRLLTRAQSAAFFAELVHFRRVSDTSLSHRAAKVAETAGYLKAWLAAVAEWDPATAGKSGRWKSEIEARLRRHVEIRSLSMTPAEFVELLSAVGEGDTVATPSS